MLESANQHRVDVMDFQTFKDSLDQPEPPADLPPPVRALWHQAEGNWDEAHRLVQGENTEAAAWVHAFLHRVEGDASNAAYWYGIAGQANCDGALSSEWREIASQLLEAAYEPALELDQ